MAWLEYESAAERFQAAYEANKDPAYLFNVAVCYERLKRWGRAVRFFDRFVREAPKHASVPDARARAATARQARAAIQARVLLRTKPPGATAEVVTAEGQMRCKTPCEATVDPGETIVRYMLAGRTERLIRTLRPSETWTPLATFAGLVPMGTLLIRVDVTGARVTVNGEPAPSGRAVRWAAGRYKILVTHPAFGAASQVVSVDPDRITTVELSIGTRPDPARARRITGWSLLGAGGLAVISGTILAVLAKQANDSAAGIANGGVYTLGRSDELAKLRGQVRARSIGADISFAVGAASVATGLVLWLTALKSERKITEAGWPLLRF